MNPEETMFIVAAIYLSPRLSDQTAIIAAMVLSVLGFVIRVGRLI